ncbi:hypothetical protein [Marinomonas sp.]|uniref:hypothetical protein n=1 Tax=Marinomonas sp. TaxID=1904862 RepID=UPI003A8EB4FB
MIDEKLEKSAIAKGLTIVKAKNGFSVKKEGVQIRFCFNEDSLSSFLSDTGDDLVFDDELVEKNTGNHVIDKVVTKTVVEIREVVIKDINMPFSSMVREHTNK